MGQGWVAVKMQLIMHLLAWEGMIFMFLYEYIHIVGVFKLFITCVSTFSDKV